MDILEDRVILHKIDAFFFLISVRIILREARTMDDQIPEMINQYGDLYPDCYHMFSVRKENGSVRVFDTPDARRDAWAYRDKHGGVVLITRMNRKTEEIDVFPDRKRPDE